jgi:hypothetical protein
MNATISTNRKGELALQLGGAAAFKGRPTLTADTVAAWEEIIVETRGGAAGAVSKVGKAVARAALPRVAREAASAAVDSAVDSATSAHTVRVDWIDGKQSLIHLPDKLFRHLAILLADCQIATAAPAAATPMPASPPGVIGHLAKLAGAVRAPQPEVTEQIAKLAALRDQGVLTEDEFAAKKAELLGRI